MTPRKSSPWTWIVGTLLVFSVYVVAYFGLVNRYDFDLGYITATPSPGPVARTRKVIGPMLPMPTYSSNPAVDSIVERIFRPIHSLDRKVRRKHWQPSP